MLKKLPEEMRYYIMDGEQHAVMVYRSIPDIRQFKDYECKCNEANYGKEMCALHNGNRYDVALTAKEQQEEYTFDFVVYTDGSLGYQDNVDFMLPDGVQDIKQALKECGF